MVPPPVIEELVRNGEDYKVFIMRGLPGSGKTWLSEDIMRLCRALDMSFAQCSADRWFERGNSYCFRSSELAEAHEYCRGKFLLHVKELTNVIVVDNTNLRTDDYQYYMRIAGEHWYETYIIEFRVDSEDEALRVCHRSEHIRNIDSYNPWGRWCRVIPDPDAIVLSQSDLRGPSDVTILAASEQTDRHRELVRRGYM